MAAGEEISISRLGDPEAGSPIILAMSSGEGGLGGHREKLFRLSNEQTPDFDFHRSSVSMTLMPALPPEK